LLKRLGGCVRKKEHIRRAKSASLEDRPADPLFHGSGRLYITHAFARGCGGNRCGSNVGAQLAPKRCAGGLKYIRFLAVYFMAVDGEEAV